MQVEACMHGILIGPQGMRHIYIHIYIYIYISKHIHTYIPADIAEERMQVEASMHGILIGPQGTTIRSIEESCGVTVRFEKLPEPCLVVKGTSEERACAMKKAHDILELASSERIVPLDDKYSLNNVRVLVKNNGEIVRQIETETDSRIRIDMDTTQRKFRVRGSPEGRDKAIAMIFAQLDAAIERCIYIPACVYLHVYEVYMHVCSCICL